MVTFTKTTLIGFYNSFQFLRYILLVVNDLSDKIKLFYSSRKMIQQQVIFIQQATTQLYIKQLLIIESKALFHCCQMCVFFLDWKHPELVYCHWLFQDT